jgi:hypothetical protein
LVRQSFTDSVLSQLAGGDRLSDRVSSEDEDEGQLDEYEDDE